MIHLKPIENEQDVYRLWQIGFSTEHPEWKKWDGPYFNDYQCYDYPTFIAECSFWKSKDSYGVYEGDVLIGDVSRYWENKDTRWLEIGIVIYDENYWGGGYGTEALRQFITKTFLDYPEIERVGLTTWSGNIRMMKVAEKLGMLQEACIRKVRYWQGVYYDSVKYGVLREEWQALIASTNRIVE